MNYVLFRADPYADMICDYLKTGGVSAFVKESPMQTTGLPLADESALFVAEEQMEEANRMYQEWKEAFFAQDDTSEDNSDEIPEKKKIWKRIAVWMLLIVFVGSLLIRFASVYFTYFGPYR